MSILGIGIIVFLIHTAASVLVLVRLRKSGHRHLVLPPVLLGIIASAAVWAYGLEQISNSRSSTAAIGLVFLPFYALFLGGVAGLNLWALTFLAGLIWRRPPTNTWSKSRILALLLAVIIPAWTVWKIQTHYARQSQIADAKSQTGEDLDRIIKAGIAERDFEVLRRTAANPATSTEQLEELFAFARPKISRPGAKEFGILYELARNPKTPPEILLALGESPAAAIGVALALNPNSPPELVPTLVNSPEWLVRHWAARHRSITKADLEKLASDPNPSVARNAQVELKRQFPEPK